jgi:hypothetical protein
MTRGERGRFGEVLLIVSPLCTRGNSIIAWTMGEWSHVGEEVAGL